MKQLLKLLSWMMFTSYTVIMIVFELHLSQGLGYSWHLIFQPALLLAFWSAVTQLYKVVEER